MKKIIQSTLVAATVSLPFMLTPVTASAGDGDFLGEISYVGFNFAPRHYAKCDGAILSISSYTALFSLLGTAFGGNGTTTFALPEMRGRVPVHYGNAPGLGIFSMGQRSGNTTVALNANNVPGHTHPATATSVSVVNAVNTAGNSAPGSTSYFAKMASLSNIYSDETPDVTLNPAAVETSTDVEVTPNTGGGQPVSIMQPYTVLNCIIATEGVYPSRS